MATHSSILAWRIPMDRGAWWATAHGATKSQTQQATEQRTSCFQTRKEAREQVAPQGEDMPAPYMYLLPSAQNNFPEINNPKEWTRKTLVSLFPMNQDIHEIWDQITGDEKKIKKLCYIESPKDVGMQNLRKRHLQWGIRALPPASLYVWGAATKKRDEWSWFPHASEEGPLGGGDGEGRGSKSECRELQNETKHKTKINLALS